MARERKVSQKFHLVPSCWGFRLRPEFSLRAFMMLAVAWRKQNNTSTLGGAYKVAVDSLSATFFPPTHAHKILKTLPQAGNTN